MHKLKTVEYVENAKVKEILPTDAGISVEGRAQYGLETLRSATSPLAPLPFLIDHHEHVARGRRGRKRLSSLSLAT